MLAQRLRENREILVVNCTEPTIFRVIWTDVVGKRVKVGVDAERSASIYRDYQEDTIRGLPWTCERSGFVEVEARAPGIFKCQVNRVADDQFDITVKASDDFLFEFISENGKELFW